MQFAESAKKLAKKCFFGEVKASKVTLWLLGLVCLLVGTVCGLCIAPMTHGISIGCDCGNNYMLPKDRQEKEEEEE